ncbi:MAG TPA: YsnF/AvaK domain-containing protein [Acetobacteraceae bacterium]|nr:YsnF/AvaK domain-containing protein [Acetobacteraceae bacterium]
MAQETIVAVFDTAAHAQAAVRDIEAAGIPSSDITQHAETTGTSTATGMTTRREEPGFWARLFGMEDEDYRQDQMVYDRTLQSGGVVVTVRVSDAGNMADRVMQILEGHNPVDIEERAASYGITGAAGTSPSYGTTVYDATSRSAAPMTASERSPEYDTVAYDSTVRESSASGMTGTEATSLDTTRAGTIGTGTMGTGATTGAGLDATGMGTTGMGTAGLGTTGMGTGTLAGEGERIQLAEEALQVGKRTINRGTTRIRRYVVETPVEENVTLRNESVSVERRPVTGTGSLANDAFTEKTIEVNEMSEEPVIAKTARVTEEVVVRKDVDEHVETVRDTVRKEKLDVEKVAGSTSVTGAAGTGTSDPVTNPSGTRGTGI